MTTKTTDTPMTGIKIDDTLLAATTEIAASMAARRLDCGFEAAATIFVVGRELAKLPPELQLPVAKIVSAACPNDDREIERLIGEVGAALLKATATPAMTAEERLKALAKLPDVLGGR